jgi:hypothetical protein
MTSQNPSSKRVFKVIDAMDAPHRGRIVRLRLMEGEAPTVRQLKGARLRARSPNGEEETLVTLGFASFWGRPSDGRLRRTGRVDLIVEGDQGSPLRVSAQWKVFDTA